MNLPVGAVTVVCLVFFLRVKENNHAPASVWGQIVRLDPLGTILLVPSVVALLLALQWGGSTYAWNDPSIIALFVVFCVLFGAFSTVQVLMPDTATVPARVIGQRSILCGAVFMFCLAGSMMMTIYFLPLWCKFGPGLASCRRRSRLMCA